MRLKLARKPAPDVWDRFHRKPEWSRPGALHPPARHRFAGQRSPHSNTSRPGIGWPLGLIPPSCSNLFVRGSSWSFEHPVRFRAQSNFCLHRQMPPRTDHGSDCCRPRLSTKKTIADWPPRANPPFQPRSKTRHGSPGPSPPSENANSCPQRFANCPPPVSRPRPASWSRLRLNPDCQSGDSPPLPRCS